MRRRVLVAAAALAAAPLAGVAGAGPAGAAAPAQTAPTSPGSLVSAVPASFTPNVLDPVDGTSTQDLDTSVQAITEVGTTMVVGGTFASGIAPGGSQTATGNQNSYLFATDSSTGAVSAGFDPVLNGTVKALAPGPSVGGEPTVYVGGSFTEVNGQTSKSLALLYLGTGEAVSTFKVPAMNGMVNSLAVTHGLLVVGGTFTKLGTATRDGIASLDETSGAVTGYLTFPVTGHHHWYKGCKGCADAAVGITSLAVNPAGTRMVVLGNFAAAGGLARAQVAMVDLSPTVGSVSRSWSTGIYSAACDYADYDSYVRDVAFSPDGSFFAIAATGGGGMPVPNTVGCDSVARFETTTTGSDVAPSWVDYAGNDTIYSVAVSDDAVYIGGHNRWVNNPDGSDFAGPGAIPRPGLGALDPLNGMPFSWNPGRNPRGDAVYAMYVDSTGGLWIGSDTDYIGDQEYMRDKLAYFPAGGETLPGVSTPTLPGTVELGGPTSGGVASDSLVSRTFDPGTDSVGPATAGPSGSIDWQDVHGAFLLNGELYYMCVPTSGNPCDSAGDPQGLYEASFSDSGIGTPSYVQPFNDAYWDDVQTGSGQTYQGQPPPLYGDAAEVSGMFYSDGSIYYLLAGQPQLYSVYFEPESGAVGATRWVVASTVSFATAQGVFSSGNELYWVDAHGRLQAAAFSGGAVTGASSVLDSSIDWAGQAVFVGPD